MDLGIFSVLGGLLRAGIEFPRIAVLSVLIGWLAGMCVVTRAPFRLTNVQALVGGAAWSIVVVLMLLCSGPWTSVEAGSQISLLEVALSLSFVYACGYWFGWTSATLIGGLLDWLSPGGRGPRS